MTRPLSAAATLLALALLLPAPAPAQDAADARLKALIRGNAKKSAAPARSRHAKAEPAAQLGDGKDEDSALTWSAAQLQADADEALLHGLLFAVEPAPREIRVFAIEDLALLGDPRALDVLAQLAMDPDPVIATAAVRAVGHFQHPRAETILAHTAGHPSIPAPVKSAAIEALPFQATATAHAALLELARSADFPPALRHAAQQAADAMTLPKPPTQPAPPSPTPPTSTSQR